MPKYPVSKMKRQQALRLRKNSTDVEFILWRLLRSRQLKGIKFRRQVPIGPWIADFVTFEQKVIIEADDSQHAESVKDQTRDADLQVRGFQILRFWNNDILENEEGVLQTILQHLDDPPHPAAFGRDPLPPEGKRTFGAS